MASVLAPLIPLATPHFRKGDFDVPLLKHQAMAVAVGLAVRLRERLGGRERDERGRICTYDKCVKLQQWYPRAVLTCFYCNQLLRPFWNLRVECRNVDPAPPPPHCACFNVASIAVMLDGSRIN